MSAPDFLIAGQGLAGSVFALTAIARGRTVEVVDPQEATTCSRVAAGLMNPISGPRLALGEDEEVLWSSALDFYRRWEKTLGVSFFEERPILRLFTDQAQADRWNQRLRDPRYDPWHEPLPPDWEDRAPFGGFTTRRCGRLHCVPFLDATRAWLRNLGAFRQDRIETGAQTPLVWCLGHHARHCGPFAHVPIRPARGTILTIHAPRFHETRIIHAGKWILPQRDDLYRVGSTYEWEASDASPSPQAREELTAFIDTWIDSPWDLIREEAAIRPMARQGRPILGPHPTAPHQILFNGLGSRGSLLAPWHANRLLDHLEKGSLAVPEFDLAVRPV